MLLIVLMLPIEKHLSPHCTTYNGGPRNDQLHVHLQVQFELEKSTLLKEMH